MKNKFLKTLSIVSILTAVLLLCSCKYLLVGKILENTPVQNFEVLWNDFDRLYGLFLVKNIDWDDCYVRYRSQIYDTMSDEEFFTVVTKMLDELNDNHVALFTNNENFTSYHSGIYDSLGNNNLFNANLVLSSYLSEYKLFSPASIGVYKGFWGVIGNDIGYIYFSGFENGLMELKVVMRDFLRACKDCTGIIVDVRNNEGGRDQEGKYLAGFFASEKKLYMTSRFRNGPSHDDFDEGNEWYVEPEGEFQFTKPVVLLTDRWAISAAETFTMAMRQNSNVTQIGNATSGAISDAMPRELLNGWLFTLSIGDYRDAQGISYEGVGIYPHIVSINTKEDIAAGRDGTLERAMEFIRLGE
jgi:C-terminal processing protease CtpA/Prc